MNIDNIYNSWTFSDITNPLPVEFVSFNVRRKGEDALLTWQTANEFNAEYFEVQRSFDGEKFEPVGKVSARNAASDYAYSDVKVTALGQKVIYYRLRQVDTDGKFKFTAIRSLRIEDLKENIAVFPTPFSNDLIVSIQNPEGKTLTFTMLDELGREIFVFEENANSVELNLQDRTRNLPSGTYILTAAGFSDVKTFKLIKN
jgi:hypothetical protein